MTVVDRWSLSRVARLADLVTSSVSVLAIQDPWRLDLTMLDRGGLLGLRGVRALLSAHGGRHPKS